MVELHLLAPQSLVEPISEGCMDALEALSVAIEDADAGTQTEQALFGEPGMPLLAPGWQRSTLKVLFKNHETAMQAATQLLAQEWATDVKLLAIEEVADQDWVRLTQSQFHPVEITPHFWVVPSWHEAPAQAQRVLRLDPGLAFGTGTHPTTRMCLRWIARHASFIEGARVLDYGCGSGILAIATAQYGAAQIDALDIDPAAVQATAANAQANSVHTRITADLPAHASGTYAVVLANILASPLTLLAPLLCQHITPGGHLVLAGILERQSPLLVDAYAPWCRLEIQDNEEGWVLMTAQTTTP